MEFKAKYLAKNFLYFYPVSKKKAQKMKEMLPIQKNNIGVCYATLSGHISVKIIPKWFLVRAREHFKGKKELLSALGRCLFMYFGLRNASEIASDAETLYKVENAIHSPTKWGLWKTGLLGPEFHCLNLKPIFSMEQLIPTDYKFEKQKVYILIDHNTGMYKIGRSKQPLFREKTLQSEKPTIQLIKIFANASEKKLHETFKNKRVRGEWFDLNLEDFEKIGKMYN